VKLGKDFLPTSGENTMLYSIVSKSGPKAGVKGFGPTIWQQASAFHAVRDFTFFIIANINSGHIKFDIAASDAERLRKLRDLKDRVEPLIEAAKLIKVVQK
jgi:hypothetical protein